MGPVLPIVGAATGVAGAIGGKNQQRAANAAASSAAGNQQQIDQQIMNNVQNQTGQYNQFYKPQLGNLSAGLGSEASAVNPQIGQLVSQLMQSGIDPSVISKITGIDANQLVQHAVQYMSNPQGTQTGQIGGNVVGSLMNTGGTNLAQTTPGAQGFFQNEMQNGINPQYAQNAQNQIQQALNMQQQNAIANAKPGQNVNALLKDMNNQALTQSTNLAGNLAGQGQTFANQGAQGSLNAASGLDTQKSSQLLSALQSAGVIDAQTMSMLQNAANAGVSQNQQAYTNLGTSTASGQSILGSLQNFIGQGQNAVANSYAPSQGVANQYANQAQNAASTAQQAGQGVGQAWGSVGQNLAQLFPGQRNMNSGQAMPGAAPLNSIGPIANGNQYASNVSQGYINPLGQSTPQ